MQTGKLRHRLTFWSPNRAQNDIGEWVDDPEELFTTWGSIEPLSGRTYFEAKQSTADVDGKIRIRYRHIDPTWFITWTDQESATKTFRIVSVIQPNQRGVETQILYKESLD